MQGGLSPEFYKVFGSNSVRKGGPVARLQMLHRVEAVGGTTLKRGQGGAVFAGGDWKQATQLVVR